MDNTELQVKELPKETGLANVEDLKYKLQDLAKYLNQGDPVQGVDKTPDGKAKTLTISHVEMTLDEVFLGLWETENFKWTVITNEVVGSIDLIVTNPVTGQRMKRVGAASITIMVDKAPANLKDQDKNRWHLNPDNKKSNALDMGFPKLKAECLKNAAQSLGKIFGRDLNRKITDNFNELRKKPIND